MSDCVFCDKHHLPTRDADGVKVHDFPVDDVFTIVECTADVVRDIRGHAICTCPLGEPPCFACRGVHRCVEGCGRRMPREGSRCAYCNRYGPRSASNGRERLLGRALASKPVPAPSAPDERDLTLLDELL